MATATKKKEEFTQEKRAVYHKIRITLSSRDVKALEKVCADLITKSKEQKLKPKGPVRLPTKVLKLTVRKSPCGNGTATFDRYEMRIHKRLIDLYSPSETVKKIVSYTFFHIFLIILSDNLLFFLDRPPLILSLVSKLKSLLHILNKRKIKEKMV